MPAQGLFVQIKVAPGKQIHPALRPDRSARAGKPSPELGRTVAPSVPVPWARVRTGTCWGRSAPQNAPVGHVAAARFMLLQRKFGRGGDVPVGWHSMGTLATSFSHKTPVLLAPAPSSAPDRGAAGTLLHWELGLSSCLQGERLAEMTAGEKQSRESRWH